MTDPHRFDRHLGNASGDPDQQKRELGNRLLADAKANGSEWKQGLAQFLPTVADLISLPNGSWLLSMCFTLARPFTSKSESAFHPYEGQHEIQNPIARDHLTGLPLVTPTTWKGHFRFAARMVSMPETMIHRLFGETLGDEGGRAGRLHFFPTFFTADAQREVITPLKRSTRTPAHGPISIEVVPSGSTGTFCLLYLSHPKGPEWAPSQIADDLDAIAPALKAMFLDYGFSAKKTAGWGVVEDVVSHGKLSARGAMWPDSTERAKEVDVAPSRPLQGAFLPLMDEDGEPKSVLRKADGAWLSNNEFNALAEKPGSLNDFKDFRRWHDAHGAEWRRSLAVPKRPPVVPPQTYPIVSVTALTDRAFWLASRIRAEGANG